MTHLVYCNIIISSGKVDQCLLTACLWLFVIILTDLKEGTVKSSDPCSDEGDELSLTGDDKPSQVSRFGENQSTVVSRVPNKSVEDLYHSDCSGCSGATGLSPLPKTKHDHQGEPVDSDGLVSGDFHFEDNLESLGACGGVDENQSVKTDESLDDFRVEGKILQKLLNMDKIEKSVPEQTQSGSAFGVIKDISVSNILIEEDDKTKHFSKKDFSNLSRSKPKIIERGNARLFAANTPGDDDKVFTLLSPESDFSESSSSEVWGYRPQLVHEPSLTETPETDSSVDACSYADLPNQNMYYRHSDSTNETSPVISDEIKVTNLIGSLEDPASKHLSIVEMTENLLQMTLEMEENVDTDSNKSNTHSAQGLTVSAEARSSDIDSQNAPGDKTPLGGEETNESGEVTIENTDITSKELPTVNDTETDCQILDLESINALEDVDADTTPVVMETQENSGIETGEVTLEETGETNQPGETRSTFV